MLRGFLGFFRKGRSCGLCCSRAVDFYVSTVDVSKQAYFWGGYGFEIIKGFIFFEGLLILLTALPKVDRLV